MIPMGVYYQDKYSQGVIDMLLKNKLWFCFVFFISSFDVFSQNLMPRPTAEGYRGLRSGIIDIMSKDINVVAEAYCQSFSGSSYLYEIGTGYSSADWPYSAPEYMPFKCASGPMPSHSLWHPCCVVVWNIGARVSEENTSENCPKTVGNPIDIGLAEKIQTEEDYNSSSSSPLRLSRYYSSGSQISPSSGSFGFGWKHTYDRRIIMGSVESKSDPVTSYWQGSSRGYVPVSQYPLDENLILSDYDYAYVVRPNGKSLYHYRAADTWQTDHGVLSTLSLLPDNTGWLFITKDNSREIYDRVGRLRSIENIHDQIQTLHYELSVDMGGDDNPQTLDRVEDENGNFLIFEYNSDGYIQQITGSNGDIYEYTYRLQRSYMSLEQVTYPNSTSRSYHYITKGTAKSYTPLLSGITDERGVRYVSWEYDRDGKAISSEHAEGTGRFSVSYSIPSYFWSNSGTVGSVIVTNPLAKETTYHFTSWRGTAQLTQVEGHPSANCAGANQAYTYDTNGFMASKTDWKGNVTTYIHNNRGQELSRTEASGTPEVRTIVTEWHVTFNLPTKIIEPERETLFSYDSDGRLTSKEINPR
jgi:YD repeat-containing protein